MARFLRKVKQIGEERDINGTGKEEWMDQRGEHKQGRKETERGSHPSPKASTESLRRKERMGLART